MLALFRASRASSMDIFEIVKSKWLLNLSFIKREKRKEKREKRKEKRERFYNYFY